MHPIRVLVAHGSTSDRARLIALLRNDRELAVIGEAIGVDQALAMTKRHKPQLVMIGIHLPTAGGLEATRRIMVEVPTPIVILADDADGQQAQKSVSALRSGALAVICKPWKAQEPSHGMEGYELGTQRFLATIKALSRVKVIHHRYEPAPPETPVAPPPLPAARAAPRIVAIAASTGGPAALQELLSALPANFSVPVLVVQHIAAGFVQSLAEALDAACPLKVRLAEDGEPLTPQTVFMAPDGKHLGVNRLRIALSNDAPVGGFRPSATVLFETVARAFGPSSAHVILTGMGRDGVAGLAVARQLGGRVFAQDRASSVVFGMPGEAVNAGVVDAVVPIAAIATELVKLTRGLACA
jgi:two-component system, chemotaxis family, protein-glutamate methylesterase/glutaminase